MFSFSISTYMLAVRKRKIINAKLYNSILNRVHFFTYSTGYKFITLFQQLLSATDGGPFIPATAIFCTSSNSRFYDLLLCKKGDFNDNNCLMRAKLRSAQNSPLPSRNMQHFCIYMSFTFGLCARAKFSLRNILILINKK